jgi:DNA polymerase-1
MVEDGGGSKRGPLYLLDGSSLLFRAFHALPEDLATSTGVVTNALHGFLQMLASLLRDRRPGGLAVAFDRSTPTFRHERLPSYKGNRVAMPEALAPQFDLARAVLDALAIPHVDLEGYEADDVLATLATRAAAAQWPTVVVSGDRDVFQLVQDPWIQVLYTRRGLSDTVLYDEAGIEERTGAPPSRYCLLASLRGDPSDNLPGVPGVGEKTAGKLAAAYVDLADLYAHLEDLSPRLRTQLEAHREQLEEVADLVPLVRDAPVPLALDDLVRRPADPDEARRVLEGLELRSAWRSLAPLVSGDGSAAPSAGSSDSPDRDRRGGGEGSSGSRAGTLRALRLVVPGAAAEARDLLAGLGQGAPILVAARFRGEPGRSPLVGVGLAGSAGGEGLWLAAELFDGPDGEGLRAELGALFRPGGEAAAGHGVKELLRQWLPVGLDLPVLSMDTAVAAFLLDPDLGRAGVGELARRFLGARPPEPGPDAAGDPVGSAASELAVVAALLPRLTAALEEAGMTRLHEEVERPLVRVLARMEVVGIGVDRAALEAVSATFAEAAANLAEEVQRLAGERFNVNSTPQLRQVLFEKLHLTPGKRTKTGYSTDAQTLERLRHEHPVVETLLRYREVEKLRSTYGAPLLAEVAEDGRIHATFHQTVARTGRLSSDRPNLHNIPVRTEEGAVLRRAFVPRPGSWLLVADYDQIELRVIAHLSGDPGLLAAFAEGRDVHRAVAARVFGVPEEEVTSAQRARAKMVSYGLAYGMEAYGLAQRLGIDPGEARAILDSYFAAFPAVKAFMDRTVAEARERGYTVTPLGRRRPLPDLLAANRAVRQAAERQAMNAGVQGLAADLFKLALVRIDGQLERAGLAARLVLQVHDEVLLEVPEVERPAVEPLVVDTMRGVAEAVPLRVPLEVSVGWGRSWAEAKH